MGLRCFGSTSGSYPERLSSTLSSPTMKTKRPDKRIADLICALEDLVFVANRVNMKYGHSEDDVPSDWTEWVDLRASLVKAKHAIAREKR